MITKLQIEKFRQGVWEAITLPLPLVEVDARMKRLNRDGGRYRAVAPRKAVA